MGAVWLVVIVGIVVIGCGAYYLGHYWYAVAADPVVKALDRVQIDCYSPVTDDQLNQDVVSATTEFDTFWAKRDSIWFGHHQSAEELMDSLFAYQHSVEWQQRQRLHRDINNNLDEMQIAASNIITYQNDGSAHLKTAIELLSEGQ